VGHGGDERRSERHVEVGVPDLEGRVARQPLHPVVRRCERGGEAGDEAPRDRDQGRHARCDEQRQGDPHDAPAGTGVREDVLALFGEGFLRQLLFESGGAGHGGKILLPPSYSYRSATMGSRLAARFAGQIPKNRPTAALNTNASRMANGQISVFPRASLDSTTAPNVPNTTPIIPHPRRSTRSRSIIARFITLMS